MRNFLEDDDFSVIHMTTAMQDIPVVPAYIGSLGLFTGGGINSTTVGVEELDGDINIIPVQPRGTMPEVKTTKKRSLRAIAVPHIPKNASLIADSVQGVRSFGAEDESVEAVAAAVNNKLSALKADHEATWEWHRIGALQGQVLDADGTSVILDLFDEFGIVRLEVDWDTADVNGLKLACIDLRRKMKTALKGVVPSKIRVEASPAMWEKLLTSVETKDAFNRYQENSFQRESNAADFFYSQIEFNEMSGSVGATPFVPDDEGFAFPFAGKQVYEQFFAPGTFMEAVNTVGLPYYAKQERMRFDTGVEIHTQSNPLFIVKKPAVLIRVTMS